MNDLGAIFVYLYQKSTEYYMGYRSLYHIWAGWEEWEDERLGAETEGCEGELQNEYNAWHPGYVR